MKVNNKVVGKEICKHQGNIPVGGQANMNRYLDGLEIHCSQVKFGDQLHREIVKKKKKATKIQPHGKWRDEGQCMT